MRLAVLGWLLAMAGAAADPSYQESILAGRQKRLDNLKTPTGWLSLAGLFWLKPGTQTFGSAADNDFVFPSGPAHAGRFELTAGRASILWADGRRQELRPDTSGSPDVVTVERLSFLLIERGGKLGIRLRDPQSAARKDFGGLQYYPIDPQYRIRARFVAQPSRIPIPNVLGQVEPMASPGYVEFDLGGRRHRLFPVLESPDSLELFFIFKDLTSGKETYPAGRFVYAPLPQGGVVDLDFNRAYNPPCAFTPYATCPLPPKENRLVVPIRAGELRHGH